MTRYPLAIFLLSLVSSAQVILRPIDNVPKIVSSKPEGTTFIFTPGTYRLSEPILPEGTTIGFSARPPATRPRTPARQLSAARL